MEMFNTHRRDILDFDNYMDLKKPGFGGPNSAIPLKDGRGKLINDEPKLSKYHRTVERHPAFSHPVYDPTYKAMTHDLVYKQEGKKPFKYRDPYLTAVPVIEYDPVEEKKSYTSFTKFINESQESQVEEIVLRGKGDDDAISDAEDKLFQKNIDWDNFFISGSGERIDYTDADGDLVAYVDIKARRLYIMPDAAQMPEEKVKFLKGTDSSREEEELDREDDYYRDDEESFKMEEPSSPSDIKQIEDLLRSFE